MIRLNRVAWQRGLFRCYIAADIAAVIFCVYWFVHQSMYYSDQARRSSLEARWHADPAWCAKWVGNQFKENSNRYSDPVWCKTQAETFASEATRYHTNRIPYAARDTFPFALLLALPWAIHFIVRFGFLWFLRPVGLWLYRGFSPPKPEMKGNENGTSA